ncbi:MAG: family 43 glycosylhydrolase, partial [Planctomycetota bacterium]
MNPDLAVGSSVTHFVQSNPGLAQAVWSVTDVPSFTYYPLDANSGWIARPPAVVEQDLDALLTFAGDTQIVFQEIGYPTGFANGNIGASEELQREFVARIIPAMRARPKIRFWSLYGSRDVPQWFIDLILQSGDDPNLTEFVTTLGLVREDGSRKPAYRELLSQIEGDPCTLWTKHPDPVWEGFSMAADPCVIRDGDTYRMYFTGFLPQPDRSFIGMASSPDGLNWDWATPVDANTPVSIALDGRPGQWDQFLQSAHVMKVGNEFWMYYTGYVPAPGWFVNPFEIGLATSPDGINWTRVSNDPVFRLAPSGPDNGAMTSQTVVRWNEMFYMVYLGWEIDDQGGFADVRIRGATSHDGINWTRRAQPVFGTPSDELPWLDLALEPSLMQASDGVFYLFISCDNMDNMASPTSIAVLRSCHPFGPWEACPDPILIMTQPWEDNAIVAPHVMEDEGMLRMWYHGLTFNDAVTGERFRIGYAETNFDANPTR